MSGSRIVLVPRDGLFLKDGRGWHTTATGVARSRDWPFPGTIRGALRSRYGRRLEERRAASLTPDQWRDETDGVRLRKVLPVRRSMSGRTWSRMWPVPRDAVYREGPRGPRVEFLRPEASLVGLGDGADSTLGSDLLWPAITDSEKPIAPPRWWDERELTTWLGADPGAGAEFAARRPGPSHRVETHVAIDAGRRTAAPERLFSTEVVEPFDEQEFEWGIAVDVAWPEGSSLRPGGPVTLGGDRKLGFVEDAPSELFEAPPSVRAQFKSGAPGLRLVVVTPALFEGGWLPDVAGARASGFPIHLPGVPGETVIRAAYVDRPVHYSGWDMTGNRGRGTPRRTQRFVPPGSVYFVQKAGHEWFTCEEAMGLWLGQIGGRSDDGCGLLVPGWWTPPESEG